jgi:hypothetical protein
MLVLVLLLLGFVGLRGLNRIEPADPVQRVEYEQPARFARESADFEVLTPRRLPDGWFATSVRFDDERPQAWHLGFLTAERRYVGLDQVQQSVADAVEDLVGEEAEAGGSVTIDGVRWLRYEDGRDLGLARRDEEQGITTLVVGTAPEDELVRFVQSLK